MTLNSRMTDVPRIICGLLLMMCGAMPITRCQAAVEVTQSEAQVTLSNVGQRLTFNKIGEIWKLTTEVKSGDVWTPLFDAAEPIIQGPLFKIEPSECRVTEDRAERKHVQLRGARGEDQWTLDVEACSTSPLIAFTVTCNFTKEQKLKQPQPTIALWLKQTTVTLHLNQGPISATGTAFDTPYGYGFPAAYLWDQNREAMIYFDYSSVNWFQWSGMAGAADLHVRAGQHAGRTGLGLFPWHLTGDTLKAGPMVTKFYLYSASSSAKPTKFEALDHMLQVFGGLHTATAPIPNDVLGGGKAATWEDFARRAVADGMIDHKTCATSETRWRDSPLELVPATSKMFLHPTRLTTRDDVTEIWSLMTNSMHLAPWWLWDMMAGRGAHAEALRLKKDQLPRSYMPRFRMLGSGTEMPERVFNMEIGWNNFYYYAMFPTIYEILPPEEFNPAIIGRMLMGLEGMRMLAHNVEYVIPTYFDPERKQPMVLTEKPGLGTLREPYTAGVYAYAMMKGHEYSREEGYKTEAFAALDRLMNGMRYTEDNEYFTRTYTEAIDMPVMSVIGASYGAVAAWKVYEATGYQQFKTHARNITNVLLTMTYWREDHSNAVAERLQRQGLFFAGSSSRCATPWETAEAIMAIAWMLKHDVSGPRTELMLRMQNLNRINSFHFYPATFTEAERRLNPKLESPTGQYFPIEDYYGVENPGGSSGENLGGTAFYHFGNALWNWWMYEALCLSDDRSVLTLNMGTLDDYRATQSGARRDFMIYNPHEMARTFNLKMLRLPQTAGEYEVDLKDSEGKPVTGYPQRFTLAQLTHGIAMPTLAPHGYWRLTLNHPDAKAMLADLAQQDSARNRLSVAYQKLQVTARDGGANSVGTLPAAFEQAWASYKAGRYGDASAQAKSILEKF